MLKSDLFKEGIDGEVVKWTCLWMFAEDYQPRLLVMISDGWPMDTVTNQANNLYYLDSHLNAVLVNLEQTNEINYYRKYFL